MGVLIYENVDRPFLLHQFYLEVFSRVLFSKLRREILPTLLKGYPDNPRNEQRYSGRQIFHDKITEKFFRLSADLVFDWICYINDVVDGDVFLYIFSIHKKVETIIRQI